MKYKSRWLIKHIRKGKVIWQEFSEGNILHDEGEQALLSAYFATAYSGYGAPPANLYLGLDARAAPAEADTLASLSGEPTALSGYTREALSTTGTGVSGQDFYIHQPGAYYRADSKEVIWTAGENWAEVKNLFLCTVATGTGGKLICTKALSTPRTLMSGDALTASLFIGLSE